MKKIIRRIYRNTLSGFKYIININPSKMANESLYREHFFEAILRSHEYNLSPTWASFLRDLKRDLKWIPISKFMRWPTLAATMVYRGMPLSAINKIRASNLCSPFIKEDPYGAPPISRFVPTSSDNLLHNLYTLNELLTDESPEFSPKSVFEFGAGYGSMCRLILRMYPEVNYKIFDIPAFACLQKIYLKEIAVDDKQVVWCESLAQKREVDLFISTWAISEVPLEIRKIVFSNITAGRMLIAFQESFDGIDNLNYFSILASELSSTYETNIYPVPYLPGNYYMISRLK